MTNFSANQSPGRRWMPTTLSPSPGYVLLRSSFAMALLFSMFLVVVIGDTISSGAQEHDLEGSVQRDSDGRYRYHAAKRTTGVELPEDLNVGYELDFYAPHGAYWEGESTNQEVYDRANTDNNYQAASIITEEEETGPSSSSVGSAKSKDQDSKQKIAYTKSRDGHKFGGAAGRYSNR